MQNKIVILSLQVLNQLYVSRQESEYFFKEVEYLPLGEFAQSLSNLYHTKNDEILRISALQLLNTLVNVTATDTDDLVTK